jgi:hypothetical protein
MKITYVIGYKHTDERYQNLTRTIEWLLSIPNLDILIVEQDIESKFKNIWDTVPKISYIPTHLFFKVGFYKMINLLLPIGIVLLLAFALNFLRKRKYAQ